MTARIVRFTLLGVAISLMLAAATACFFGGGDAPAEPTPEPTVDLQATIAAAISSSVPTETPVPPTSTPAPPTIAPTPTPAPTPNLEATIAARMAAAEATRQALATPTPEPTATPTPEPPTPVPTLAPPTATPAPTPKPTVPSPTGGRPCIITGKVTIGGNPAPEGTIVQARSAGKDTVQDQTNEKGIYKIDIFEEGAVYDLYVAGVDTGADTARTSRGCRPQAINLSQ